MTKHLSEVDKALAKQIVDDWHRLPQEEKKWIPLEFMAVGWYACDGRNFNVGYWNGKEFEYERTKWNCVFDDVEYHWDTGAPHGTAKPLKYLGDH